MAMASKRLLPLLLTPSSLLSRTTFIHSRAAFTQKQPQPRTYSTPPSPPSYLNPAERKVFDLIATSLAPTKLEVQDISGGCGSMYGIDIVSEAFRGLSVMKQHRLVNGILAEEIKKWHGVQLKTRAPE